MLILDDFDEQVQALYIAYFGRAAEPDGFDYWVDRISSGEMTFAQVAASFSHQEETKGQHPFFANPNASNPEAFVDSLYQQLLGRQPDAEGKMYWLRAIETAAGNPVLTGVIIAQFISGASEDNGDAATIKNKIDAASYFTGKLDDRDVRGAEFDANFQALARDVVDNEVTRDPGSVQTSRGEVDEFFKPTVTPPSTGGGDNNPPPPPLSSDTLALTSDTDIADGFGATSNGVSINFRFLADRDETVHATDLTLTGDDALNDPGSGDLDTMIVILNGTIDPGFYEANAVSGIERLIFDLTDLEIGNYISLQYYSGLKEVYVRGDSPMEFHDVEESGAGHFDASELTNADHGITIFGYQTSHGLTVVGSTADDNVLIGDGNHQISLGQGDDRVVISASFTNSSIDVGDGDNDVEVIGDGNTEIISGGGTDHVIVGGAGDFAIETQGGSDNIEVLSSGVVTISAGSGIDTITISDNSMAPGAGETFITAGLGADLINLTYSNAENTIIVGLGESGIYESTADRVSGFDTQVDRIDFGGPAANSSNFRSAPYIGFSPDGGYADAAAVFDGTIQYYAYFYYGGAGGAMILYDEDGDRDADVAVHLTRISSFSSANIVGYEVM